MITKIAFIAHPTKDLQRSMTFFGETLGLKQSAVYGEHWAEFEAADGTTIAIDTFAPQFNENAPPYLALETDDLVAEIAGLREKGVEILQEPWPNKGEDGKEICKMALLKDPDGHSLMLHEIAKDRA